jgi:hypothetical protein
LVNFRYWIETRHEVDFSSISNLKNQAIVSRDLRFFLTWMTVKRQK